MIPLIPKPGMFFSDRCRFCGDFGPKVEPFLCNFCRDEIFQWINEHNWAVVPANNSEDKK